MKLLPIVSFLTIALLVTLLSPAQPGAPDQGADKVAMEGSIADLRHDVTRLETELMALRSQVAQASIKRGKLESRIVAVETQNAGLGLQVQQIQTYDQDVQRWSDALSQYLMRQGANSAIVQQNQVNVVVQPAW